jgi:hypothetical protein
MLQYSEQNSTRKGVGGSESNQRYTYHCSIIYPDIGYVLHV